MTSFKFVGAAIILSALSATPSFAQHMIDEPGMYSFYHPNADLGLGSTAPAANAMASVRDGDISRLRMGPVSGPALKRARSRKTY
jgi:hypothetical protein